jgi:hypothetical protein
MRAGSRRAGRPIPIVVAGLLTGTLLGGATAARAADDGVFDIAAILVGEIVVQPDPGGRSAVLSATTSIEVACAVVYGPDDSFGRIATDQDMAGGAHAVHHPVLTGLTPDSVVYYRLQGSGPDGRLYRSETLSFRTPPAVSDGPLNLALEATVVDASSAYSDAFAAERAIDGDPSTEWSSRGDGDDAFITLDLGRETAIGAVAFHTRRMGDGTAITETFSVTTDGTLLGPFRADQEVPLDVTARVLRFDVVTSTGGNTGATEIVVLAAEDPGP